MYGRIIPMNLFCVALWDGGLFAFAPLLFFTLLDVYSSFYSDVYAYDIGPGRHELRGVLLVGGGEI
jgi:hypothetical protein